MRVIAGKYRGRTLKGPKHEGLRPTADRVKEALFNIVGARIDGADFLDLFAGTGAVGIEALSRGAHSITLADRNPLSVKLIRENLKVVSLDDQIRVFTLPADRVIELLAKEQARLNFIFLDPPFAAGLLEQTMLLIAEANILKKDGWLIVEHPQQMEPKAAKFATVSSRQYGDIGLTFLAPQ